MKKTVAFSLVICMLWVLAVPVWADAGTPLDSLREIEVLLYGKPNAGALIDRLDELETDVFGAIKAGPILVRIGNLNSYLLAGTVPNSLQLKLNAVEWLVYQEVSVGIAYTRLDKLEGDVWCLAKGYVIARADVY